MNEKNIFITLLDTLGVKHTKSFSNKYFNEHSHKNDMYGLSSMLTDYGIENQGFRIKDKNNALQELEVPFIAKFSNDFIVVYKIVNKEVAYFWKDKKVIVSIDDFISKWSGLVLLVEPNEDSIEPNYGEHRKTAILRSFKYISLFFACTLILGIVGFNTKFYNDVSLFFALLINMLGVYVSYLLILKQLHIQNNHADKICSLLIDKSDCNNILESDAARFMGFSWSEIGLGYFISNILIMIMFPHLYAYVTLINICTLPYTLWSVWYQKFKARQWCPLCLAVQAILWLFFFYNLFQGLLKLPEFSIQHILIVGCIYMIPVLVLNIFISVLSEARQKEKISQELNSLKTNDELFKMLIKGKPKYEVDKTVSTILLGNPESDNLITIVSNPHCNPCAQLHKKLTKVLKKTNDYCIQYVLSSFSKDLEDSGKFMIAMYKKLNYREFLAFLDEWYEHGRHDKIRMFQKYQYDCEDIDIQMEFEKQKEWIRKMRIIATPTILIKGYELPREIYKIEDLQLLSNINIS